MNKEIYVVVGQYNHQAEEYSPLLKDLVNNLRELGEVNVFDMPCPDSKDEVEKDEFLFVHHYARPEDENMENRVWEFVRDIMALSPKACFIDYSVEPEYHHFLKLIHAAIKRYGIRIYTLNKRVPFRHVRNLFWNIRFWCQELKLRNEEDAELDRISDITLQEGYGGHNTMEGFLYYKEMQRNRAARKRLHKEQLAAIR